MAECSIQELTTADLEEAVRFTVEEVQKLRGSRVLDFSMHLARYQWLFERNPRRRDDFIGWGLRNEAGKLVGTHLITWHHFQRGDEVKRAVVSTNSYVAEGYRGPKGLGLMLNMRTRADADLCMCTTANVNSGSIWKSMKGREFYGAGWELLVPVNYSRLALSALARKTKLPLVRRCLASAARLAPPFRKKWASDLFVCHLTRDDLDSVKVQPTTDGWEPFRDASYLRWRYAEHPSGASKLLLVRNSRGDEMYLGVHVGSRGVEGEVRSLTIIDLFGAVEHFAASAVLGSALRIAAPQTDVIVLRLLAAKLWEEQLGRSARRRVLEFPTHWMQSRTLELRPEEWSATLADGDGAM